MYDFLFHQTEMNVPNTHQFVEAKIVLIPKEVIAVCKNVPADLFGMNVVIVKVHGIESIGRTWYP
jgi:hypothetical protein